MSQRLRYRLNDRGSIPGRAMDFFLFITASKSVLEPTQPPIQLVSGILFPGVKWPGREANHSPPPSTAEVKNARRYTTTPPICLHGVVLSYS
jgi:hypothetical protein